MTPNSPEGEDLGLSEPAPCWDFPKTNEEAVHILPEWTQTTFCGFTADHAWNSRAFDPTYQAQLGKYGITEGDYKQILDRLNPILESYYPFCREADTYINELRKHLTKLNQDFPQSSWELQIHKYATELSSVLFFENVFHSIKVSPARAAVKPTAAEAKPAEAELSDSSPGAQPVDPLKTSDQTK